MKILIAEDDAISRTILKKSVEKFAHECLVAEGGLRAREHFKNTPEVDLVISDWMMPGIDELEFCRRVQEKNNSCYTFFIFLTALGDKERKLFVSRWKSLLKRLKVEDLRAIRLMLLGTAKPTTEKGNIEKSRNSLVSLTPHSAPCSAEQHNFQKATNRLQKRLIQWLSRLLSPRSRSTQSRRRRPIVRLRTTLRSISVPKCLKEARFVPRSAKLSKSSRKGAECGLTVPSLTYRRNIHAR